MICMVTASLLNSKEPNAKGDFSFPCKLFLFLNVTESTWFLDFYIKISFTLALAGPRLSGLGE